jgi:fructokinase
LRAEGVHCEFLRRTAKATPLAMVDVDASGTPTYAFHGLEGLLFYPEMSVVKRHWKELVGIHVGSIPIVSRSSSEPLLALLAAAPAKVLVSFDPNVRLTVEPDVDRWRQAVDRFRAHAHMIKVSEEDIANLFGRDADQERIAESWLTHHCSLVAVTRGAFGATYYSRHSGKITVEAIPVVVADTVGAGDSFQAAMMAWLLENRHASPAELAALSATQLRTLGQFAAQAAAATCRHRGPEFPYRRTLPPAI